MPFPFRHPSRLHLVLVGVLLAAVPACDLFSPRTPEAPVEDSGSFVQPDTPDQVIENVVNAVAELNAQNYRRSFSEDFVFEPTATAMARAPSIWSGWSVQDEESYFRAVAEAARLTSGNSLRLSEVETNAGESEFTVTAAYLLTVNHRRPDLPSTLQGRLQWRIVQGEDGLWHISEWTDREIDEDAASWSDLKAAFIQ